MSKILDKSRKSISKFKDLQTVHVLTYFMENSPASRATQGLQRFCCLRIIGIFGDLHHCRIKNLGDALRQFFLITGQSNESA